MWFWLSLVVVLIVDGVVLIVVVYSVGRRCLFVSPYCTPGSSVSLYGNTVLNAGDIGEGTEVVTLVGRFGGSKWL